MANTQTSKYGTKAISNKPQYSSPEAAHSDPSVLSKMYDTLREQIKGDYAANHLESQKELEQLKAESQMQQLQAQERLQGNFQQNQQAQADMMAANSIGPIASAIMGFNTGASNGQAAQLPNTANELPDYESGLRSIQAQQLGKEDQSYNQAMSQLQTHLLAAEQAAQINQHNTEVKKYATDEKAKVDRERIQMQKEAKNNEITNRLAIAGISKDNATARNKVATDMAQEKKLTALDKEVAKQIVHITRLTDVKDNLGQITKQVPKVTTTSINEILTAPSGYTPDEIKNAREQLRTSAPKYAMKIKDPALETAADKIIGYGNDPNNKFYKALQAAKTQQERLQVIDNVLKNSPVKEDYMLRRAFRTYIISSLL